jgi:hypothetical protein
LREPFLKHLLLASALGQCLKTEESAQQYALAAQCAKNKRDYLHAVLSAFNGLKMVDGEKPEWWTDPELLSLSKQAIETHASHPLAWHMRAIVLCGVGNWTIQRDRTADDFLEASFCFHRHASMNPGLKQQLLAASQKCLHQSIVMTDGDQAKLVLCNRLRQMLDAGHPNF